MEDPYVTLPWSEHGHWGRAQTTCLGVDRERGLLMWQSSRLAIEQSGNAVDQGLVEIDDHTCTDVYRRVFRGTAVQGRPRWICGYKRNVYRQNKSHLSPAPLGDAREDDRYAAHSNAHGDCSKKQAPCMDLIYMGILTHCGYCHVDAWQCPGRGRGGDEGRGTRCDDS